MYLEIKYGTLPKIELKKTNGKKNTALVIIKTKSDLSNESFEKINKIIDQYPNAVRSRPKTLIDFRTFISNFKSKNHT
ncbi:MAG: hypothetical protein CMP91_09575 [Gammaproteobacteria bacterium]|nr:hypothetical protein [Gammaproteobacteria bacterium]MAY02623.1 hypothetical protein [Gammaproteobacteria bacterium]